VLYLLSSYCKSQKAIENALKLKYFASPQLVNQEFDLLSEIKTIYEDNSALRRTFCYNYITKTKTHVI
jgi:DNA mismatch repair protein MutS2